jgi:predicted O-methyltransferase YrrM
VARRNIDEAGLSDFVEIREGDAQQTLQNPGGSVDMVLLDGFKQLYLPMLQMLTPHLRRGAIVVADNIFTFRLRLNCGNVWSSKVEEGLKTLGTLAKKF